MTFDATNTLIRVKGSVGQHYANAAHRNGMADVDANSLNTSFGKAWKLACKTHPNFGHDEYGQSLSVRDWWKMVVLETFSGAGYRGTSDTMEQTFQQLFEDFSRGDFWDVFDDVRPVLKCFQQDGIHLSVISNFDSGLSKILWDLGLAPYFSNIVMSGELPFAKPDRRIFEHALQEMGCHDSKTALHIGDDMEKDVQGCQSVGMHAVLLNRKLRQDQASVSNGVLTTASLKDVARYISSSADNQ